MVGIKDMKMPKSCVRCDFCVEDKYADKTCVLLGYEWDEEKDYTDNHRHKDCPLMNVTPTHETCKGCTNYVNGVLDEKICLRGHELIHENFYCADFEKRGNENGKDIIRY